MIGWLINFNGKSTCLGLFYARVLGYHVHFLGSPFLRDFYAHNPEDLPEAMNDREKWRERVRDIRAGGATWWKNDMISSIAFKYEWFAPCYMVLSIPL